MLLLLLAIFISSKAQPPNNAIFFGGAGDGAIGVDFSMAANNIFLGGAGDGLGNASNNSLTNNLFFGGAGDGFANQSNNSIPNNIFLGSIGDGMSNNSNNAASNNIFIGGDGDGWNAVIFPMGPLPVKLLSFTAEYAGSAHLVKWVTTEEINTLRFEVQRSANGRDYETVGIVTPAGSASSGAAYSFRVLQPWTGNNFYRLKIIDLDGTIDYSSVVLLKNNGDLKVAVYPNPTAEFLYVRLPAISNTSVVAATIYDANGKMMMQPVLKTGTDNAIPVSQLPGGIYSLHCIINHQPFTFRFMKNK